MDAGDDAGGDRGGGAPPSAAADAADADVAVTGYDNTAVSAITVPAADAADAGADADAASLSALPGSTGKSQISVKGIDVSVSGNGAPRTRFLPPPPFQ